MRYILKYEDSSKNIVTKLFDSYDNLCKYIQICIIYRFTLISLKSLKKEGNSYEYYRKD